MSRVRSRSAHRRRSPSSSTSSVSSFEEVNKTPKIGKRGRTKMPKRLANKQAVVELGYPFEEDVSHAPQISALDGIRLCREMSVLTQEYIG